MAIQISKTVGEYFSYSGYRSCPSIYAYLDATYPGWTEETSIDVLEWSEGLRAAGEASNVNYGFYRALDAGQREDFIEWAIVQLLGHMPVGYARATELSELVTDIDGYLLAPTMEKAASLEASAKAIRPDTSVTADVYIANAFKAIAMALAVSAVSGETIAALGFSLVKAARFLSGVDQDETHGIMLTKLQKIIGVID